MQPISLTRNCPQCNASLTYKSNTSYKRAIKRADICRECYFRNKTTPQEKIDQILQLNSEGVLNREIARQLGIHHTTIGTHLKANNRQGNFANEPIDMVSKNEARCRKCTNVKPLIEFQFGRKGQKYEYRFSYCNECRKKQVYLNLNNDVNKFLAASFNRAKLRAKKFSIPFSISKKEFIEQYHKQNGLCFYTDEKLVCEVGKNLSRNSLSIDKIVPEHGYIPDNVVFTTHRINTCKCDLSLEEIKRWMPFWFERIDKFLSGELHELYLSTN